MRSGTIPWQRIRRRLPAIALAGVAACLIVGHAAADMETGDLDALRGTALELLNQDRREHDLPPLALDATVNESSQKHAEDMLRRDYYSHRSPEGETVMDRYRAAGGGTAQAVAENIARCDGCPLPPDRATVKQLQRGWMNSPEHRRNILAPGLERFGFGIAGEEGRGLYAVQNFAGPGTPRTTGGDEADARVRSLVHPQFPQAPRRGDLPSPQENRPDCAVARQHRPRFVNFIDRDPADSARRFARCNPTSQGTTCLLKTGY